MERSAHRRFRSSYLRSTDSPEQRAHPPEETNEEDFPPIGSCIVYNPIKKTVGVPLSNNRRIDITDRIGCLRSVEKMFAEDYMKGFSEFVRIAALGTPEAPRKRKSDPDSEPFSSESEVKMESSTNPPLMAGAAASGVDEKESAEETSVAHSCQTKQSSLRITEGVEHHLPDVTEASSSSAGNAQYGSSVQKSSFAKSAAVPSSTTDKARLKSMLAARAAARGLSLPAPAKPQNVRQNKTNFDCDDVRFRKVDEQAISALPVRQSERRISKLLLNNEALDDNLGIGIGDDENQRRAWHKPRSKAKEVMSHRAANGKLFFLVRQPAGNTEWLEDWQVEEQLKEKYKADYLEPGESLERPPKRKKKEKDWFESSWENYLQDIARRLQRTSDLVAQINDI